MSATAAERNVGVVIVSHSPLIARGAEDMVRQMVGESVPLAACGGNPDGELGTDVAAISAAIDAAVARTAGRLRELAGQSGGLARDVIGFQLSLLEDEEFLGPTWARIDAGSAADRAWLDHLAGEIADCESAPTDHLRARAADLRDLRERVGMAFAGDAHRNPDPLPERCVVIAGELTPSRFLELDRSRVVAVATHLGEPRRRRGDARAGPPHADAGAARVRYGIGGAGRRGGRRRRRGASGDRSTACGPRAVLAANRCAPSSTRRAGFFRARCGRFARPGSTRRCRGSG